MNELADKGAGSSWRDEVRKEGERIHESAMSASETQFEHAKKWRWVDRLIGGTAACLAAVAGVGALSQVMSIRWAGLVAILSAGVGAVATTLSAGQVRARASDSANAYRNLQQDARVFLNIDLSSLTQEEARQKLQRLVETQQQLNREADIPSQSAWARAKRNLAGGAQDFRTDE
jgi:hypothetical protein